MRNINAKTLDCLFNKYNYILGYSPAVADKLLIRKYAESWIGGFEYTTIIECFLKEYNISNRKLNDVPSELWIRKAIQDSF